MIRREHRGLAGVAAEDNDVLRGQAEEFQACPPSVGHGAGLQGLVEQNVDRIVDLDREKSAQRVKPAVEESQMGGLVEQETIAGPGAGDLQRILESPAEAGLGGHSLMPGPIRDPVAWVTVGLWSGAPSRHDA